MNGYVAFYKSKKMEVYAESSFQARQKAAAAFKAKKAFEVTVMLAEKDTDGSAPGTQVVHSTQSF